MKRYNPNEIEPKWQRRWNESAIYQANDASDRPKNYILDFFPYPSGAAMHVGHVRNYTISDVLARHARMRGDNVLHPMGWDAFGLPAENYAIKTGINPKQVVAESTVKFKQQLMQMGIGIDWSREFSSSDPTFYRWTQWFFKLLFERGLAYQKVSLQWWCETDKTVLANEQVEGGRCWRCHNLVTKKPLKQWFFKITDYADRLADDLGDLNWSDAIKTMQRNWIGRSVGAEIDFALSDNPNEKITVFTTRPDTLYGATFLVLAPEHPKLDGLVTSEQRAAVEAYKTETARKSELDRMETEREKTGVFTGAYARNPATGEQLPIWIADYVLIGYGTGAIMAVPAHDERDFAFANAFDLPVKEVVAPEFGEPRENEQFADGATVIVYDETTDCYLGLDWDKGWTGLVAGGLEGEESYESCARRELAEEAGITDIIQLVPLGEPVFAHYEHKIKNINRVAKTQGFLAIVKDRQGENTQRETHETFHNAWYEASELYDRIAKRLTNTDHWLELLRRAQSAVAARQAGKSYDFVSLRIGEGIMINSGAYNGQSSSETREKIVADLAQKDVARERVTYKIRDWLISRQRYWGAPIPIVHCTQCALERDGEHTKLELSFYDQATWAALLSGVKTVESRALNPDEPERSFARVQPDDLVRAVNKETGEKLLLRVTEAHTYETLRDLYDDSEWSGRVAVTGQCSPTYEAFEKIYAGYSADYLDKIAKHGIVAWRIEVAREPVAVPDDQLPVELPEMKSYEPSGDGRSPLARAPEWVNTTCPTCGGPATRETDTMDGFACSSWYFLRFADPHNETAPFDKAKVREWLPVDTYVGGAEHAVMHLLYARFWTKVMHDAGLIEFDEPFTALRNHGMILAPDGRKMSKSFGNVIAPDDLIAAGYGADSIRIMELFIGPWNQPANWSTEGLGGCHRFLQRVWTLADEVLSQEAQSTEGDDEPLKRLVHKTIKRVSDELHELGFNTAIAGLMETLNELYRLRAVVPIASHLETWRWTIGTFTQLLAPFAPHMTDEIWERLGYKDSIHISQWPAWNDSYMTEATTTIVVQVNGKVRAELQLPTDTNEATITAAALAHPRIQPFIADKKPKRSIYVPGKLINIVV